MTKRTLIVTAAAIFAAGTFATAAHAEGIKCGGTNACEGRGWAEAGTSLECTAKGGKVM